MAVIIVESRATGEGRAPGWEAFCSAARAAEREVRDRSANDRSAACGEKDGRDDRCR